MFSHIHQLPSSHPNSVLEALTRGNQMRRTVTLSKTQIFSVFEYFNLSVEHILPLQANLVFIKLGFYCAGHDQFSVITSVGR